ncbi:hypothetical protein [Spirosoma sordidisoli]|uniref:Uncharacterized protein n=1 Tax=Spirosoma sordidisoli TaxID=2502893 RepID=A0A4Q2UHY2_9BACT|nr:hypothetical protein [Spirosoma sordidisoli]RYC66349.1 hypothetical protein EQG79_30210 [Spirosoma sordidisoli]
MPNLAYILPGGAKAGSALVRAALDGGADGTPILIHWGNVRLGLGYLAGGRVEVVLSRPLAADDIIQASVSEQGTQAGPPVRVLGTGAVLGPWVTPTEIQVTEDNGQVLNYPAVAFQSQYGYLPASVENTEGLSTLTYPEFVPLPVNPVMFDLNAERQGGQTTVTVANVRNQRGGILTRWSGETNWGNVLSKAFTVAGTYTVEVKGSQNTDAEAVNRQLAVTIQTPPPAAPAPDARIAFYSWRNFGSQVYLFVNTTVEIQAQCPQSSDPSWREGVVYDNAYQREVLFENVPNGAVSVTIRVRGETNPAKYVTMNFTKFF